MRNPPQPALNSRCIRSWAMNGGKHKTTTFLIMFQRKELLLWNTEITVSSSWEERHQCPVPVWEGHGAADHSDHSPRNPACPLAWKLPEPHTPGISDINSFPALLPSQENGRQGWKRPTFHSSWACPPTSAPAGVFGSCLVSTAGSFHRGNYQGSGALYEEWGGGQVSIEAEWEWGLSCWTLALASCSSPRENSPYLVNSKLQLSGVPHGLPKAPLLPLPAGLVRA